MRITSQSKSSMLAALAQGLVIGILLSAVFVAGYLFRGIMPLPAAAASIPALSQVNAQVVGQYPLLTQAQQLLNEYFLRDQPSQTELEYAAIRGVLNALSDKYTFFIDPPVAQSESNVLAGKYGGIGVQVKRDEQGNFVLYPFPNSPAIKAGVQDGDILTQVNGKDIPLDMQQDAVDQLMRGEVKDNNGVTIHIKRPASKEEKDFTIAFAEIDVPSVVWRVLEEESALGYIQIMRFTNRTPGELDTAIKDLKSKSVKALILDLRDNPGGLLQESIQVAGAFLDGGVVLYEHSRAGEKSYEAPAGGLATDLPMYVLVNKGTASASELVAGALQDRKRATVIGQASYGKGTVQLIFALADKSSIHITAAEWLTPNKSSLDGKGITPDVPMIPDVNGRDVELGEAIRRLRDLLKE
jgi:carboxyl-terminal processing protease